MPINIGIRDNDQVLSLVRGTTWDTYEASFDTVKLPIPVIDLDASELKQNAVENEEVKYDFGEGEPGRGTKWQESTLTWGMYPTGVGDVAATPGALDGETPTETGLGVALAASLGGDLTHSTGSLAAVGSTTTQFVEASAGNHGAEQMVGFVDPATDKAYIRPCISYATDTGDLAFELPFTPGAGDTILGTTTILNTEDADVALQGDIVGRASQRSAQFKGGVANFEMPETDIGSAQRINFTAKIGDFNRPYTPASGGRPDPGTTRARFAAGGEFLLGKYGETTPLELKFLRVAINLNREYEVEPLANDYDVDGFGGWLPVSQSLEITLYVHHNASVPSGFTGADYWELWTSGGEENHFHLLTAWGQKKIGKIMGLYFPTLQMTQYPMETSVGRTAALQLKFNARTGENHGNNGKVWAGLC